MSSAFQLSVPFRTIALVNQAQTLPGPPILEVRTTVAPLSIVGDIRRLVKDVDPRLRIVDATTLEQQIDQKLTREVLVADLAVFFAGLTLGLVVLGAYGTVAYSVARRAKEIGIRIALGARPANITGLVLRHLLLALVAGLIGGTAITMLAGRLLASLLFGLESTDALTICGAGLILCLAALADKTGSPLPGRYSPLCLRRR